MMSQALESAWGAFRFNLFLLIGLVFSVLGAFIGQFISPGTIIFVTPYFLYLSVFFGFATLNPNIEFLIFFVLPVKVKWMAYFVGGLTAFSFLFAPSMGDRVAILAPVLNYFMFFGSTLVDAVKGRQRKAQFAVKKKAEAETALHTCELCGETDRTAPEREYRYKMQDGEAQCVCSVCRAAEN
jgi:hypothetical protein